MTAGMAFKWFKDTFCRWETEESKKNGQDVYDLLDGMAENSPPLAKGLFMLPYLAGSLQPYQAPQFRGGFYQISLECRLEDFVRALLEGVSYMLRENLELLDQISGDAGTPLISMGGGAKSSLWCQIKADVTGRKVIVKKESETASLGAAMLCAMGLSKMEKIGDVRNDREGERSCLPVKERVKAYEEGYQAYCKLLKKLIEET